MNLVVRVTVYKRHDPLRICLLGLQRIHDAFEAIEIEMHTVFVVSNDEDEEVVNTYRRRSDVIRHENKPIGAKHNYSANWILQHLDFDYFMEMGSDDVMSTPGVFITAGLMKMGLPFFGYTTLYVTEAHTRRTKLFKGSTVFGAGRCIRYDVYRHTLETLGKIWDDDKNRGLDGSSMNNIQKTCKINIRTFHLPSPIIADIKTDENINTFESFPGKEVEYVRLTPEMAILER